MKRKEMDINTFVHNFVDEIREFEESHTAYSPESHKTMKEWVSSFLIFSGYEEEQEQEFTNDEEYDDELYYADTFSVDEVVNRRKYRSFRDDDSY